MQKKPIIYSDLSKKQLENLKELYIQKKVEILEFLSILFTFS